MKRFKLFAILISALLLGPAIAASAQPTQPGHYGIFDGQTDIGIGFAGNTNFNPFSGTFHVVGGGADLWGATDAFHFTWVKLAEDASLSADVEFPKNLPQPNAKAFLMFRQSLDPGSAYADVAIHADGHITLQFREKAGDQTQDAVSPLSGSKRIRIERHGDVFTASAQAEDGKMIPFARSTVILKGPVYVGIGVCPHDVKSTIAINFSHVAIERFGK